MNATLIFGQFGAMHDGLRTWCEGPSLRRRAPLLAVAAAGLAITALAGCSSASGEPPFAQRPGNAAAVDQAGGPHSITVNGGQTSASLAVLSGVTAITVTTATMPGELMRVSTPDDSQVRPEVAEADGQVQLSLAGTGDQGPASLSVEVNSAVTWQFQFSGGATQTVLDLARGRVGGIDFTAGCSVIDLKLPRPDHTVTITLAGGATQVTMAAPTGVPSRLQLTGGASSETLGGASYSGVAGGTVLTAPGWPAAVNRYDVTAPAGISTISVTS
jgi:hypothetical protein